MNVIERFDLPTNVMSEVWSLCVQDYEQLGRIPDVSKLRDNRVLSESQKSLEKRLIDCGKDNTGRKGKRTV